MTLERAGLLVLSLGALLAAHAAYAPPAALPLTAAAAALLASLLRPARPPRALGLATLAALYGLLLGAGAFGLSLVLNPTMSDQTARAIASGIALALTAALPLCLAGATGASPLASSVPAAVGLLAVASLEPRLDLRAGQAAALAGALIWLAATARSGIPSPKVPAPRPTRARLLGLVPLALEVALALGIALAIGRSLPPIQERFDQGLYELAGRRSGRYSGFSRESRLGDLASLKLSDRVILRVFAETPQYLRGRVFTAFDGTTWSVKDGTRHALPEAAPEIPVAPMIERALAGLAGTRFVIPGRERHLAMGAAPRAVVTRVVQSVPVAGTLLAPFGKALVLAPVETLRVDEFENLEIPLEAEVESYATVNRPGARDASEPDARLLAACRALPERGVDARFLALAREIERGAPGVEERVARTAQVVSAQCRYSLEPGAFATGDPVAEFFFEKRRGYCQYFASAAALLLRAQGVPCRYVTGFAVSAENEMGGHFVVREHDAHAWIEAYIEGRGWVEIDPTPGEELSAARRRVERGVLAAALEWLEGARLRAGALLRSADLRALAAALLAAALDAAHAPWALAAAALGATLAVVRLLARRRARRPTTPPRRAGPSDIAVAPRLVGLLARADAALARAGRPRPASRAPREHLEAVPPEALGPALQAAVARIVDAYYAARYAGAPTKDEVIDGLERDLSSAPTSHPNSSQKSAKHGIAL